MQQFRYIEFCWINFVEFVTGTTLNYFLDDKINKAEILFPGVGCFLVAVCLGSAVHSSNTADNKAKLKDFSSHHNDVVQYVYNVLFLILPWIMTIMSYFSITPKYVIFLGGLIYLLWMKKVKVTIFGFLFCEIILSDKCWPIHALYYINRWFKGSREWKCKQSQSRNCSISYRTWEKKIHKGRSLFLIEIFTNNFTLLSNDDTKV